MTPIAIVTGATGGMGREIVADLARTHEVIALGRNEERLASLPAARTLAVDLTDFDVYGPNGAVGALIAGLERVDAVVLAAATSTPATAAEADARTWRHELDTDVIAPALLVRAALPKLRESAGTIVFIGSGAGTNPVPGLVVYAAAKHALRGYADSLRIEEAPHRLRVATVAPGQTDTEMLRTNISAEGGRYEPGRYIRPTSVAAAVRFVVDAPADVHLTDIAVRPRVPVV